MSFRLSPRDRSGRSRVVDREVFSRRIPRTVIEEQTIEVPRTVYDREEFEVRATHQPAPLPAP